MLKKFFRGLADSKEKKQQARYQHALYEFAKQTHGAGAPALGEITKYVARAKHDLDTSEQLDKAGRSLNVDFDQLITEVCDQIREKITELAKSRHRLPKAFGAVDTARLPNHLAEWQNGVLEIQQAYAALQRAAAKKSSSELIALTENVDTSEPLGRAVDALLVEVRTMERIRTELGG